jgi:glycosyltransferase involved in cell wall biosynthesis
MYGDDKLRALAAADLFVMPSEYESYGNAAAEAVAAGVPVLLTRGCGIAPRIDRRAGLAVDPDPDSLAQGLQLLLDDPARRDALTRARTDILSGLSWDEPLTQAEAAYRAVVEAARGRS